MKLKIDKAKIKKSLGLDPGGDVQIYATHRAHIRMHKYVPYRTGYVADNSREEPGRVIYRSSYVVIIYEGTRNGIPIKYNPEKHPHAIHHWDKAMWTAEGKDYTKEIQEYIRSRSKKW